MPAQVQGVPQGLIDLLSAYGSGGNPAVIEDILLGTLDLTRLYLLAKPLQVHNQTITRNLSVPVNFGTVFLVNTGRPPR